MSKAEENLESNKKSGLNRLFRRFASASMFGLATLSSGQAKALSDNFNDKEEVRNEYSFTINSTSNDDSTYNFEEAPSFDEDKYMTNITVRNDTVYNAYGTGAFYSPQQGDIVVLKEDNNLADYGFMLPQQDVINELIFIHERQHEIDHEEKGVGEAKLSLNGTFQRGYHLEVSALIAEKLEIRRQFKEAQTEEEKKAFFEKFSRNEANREYIRALKIKMFNPNNQTSQEFLKEMEFIKNSSINYRCDPNDTGYYGDISNNVVVQFMDGDVDVNSTSSDLEKEVKAIYQIGGFDFSTVGNQNLCLIDAPNLEVADKMLAEGVDASKVVRFIKSSEASFALADKLDVSGLSREQAEKVLQTAIVSSASANNIVENVCIDRNVDYEFSMLNGQEQTALYLDIKNDIWEKNGTLSEAGDEEKFNRLMVDAKTIELDCEAWLNGVKDILPVARLAKFTPQYKEFYSKVQENQGKVVNVDDYFSGLELPLKDKSVEEIVDNIEKREEASRKETEECNKNNPVQEEAKPRLSEPYQVKVFDLQSSVLADELKSILEKENKVENLKDNTQVEMTSIEQAEIGDREQLRAELKEQKGEIYDNAKAKSQNMGIDMRVASRSQGNLSKGQEGSAVEQHTDANNNYAQMQMMNSQLVR